jgi:hypothetical protein
MPIWRYYAAALVAIFAFLLRYRNTLIEEAFNLPSTMGETLAGKNQAYWK